MEEGRGRKRRELQVGNGEGHWRLLLTIHITIIFSSMLSHACTKNLWCCCHLCVCVWSMNCMWHVHTVLSTSLAVS